MDGTLPSYEAAIRDAREYLRRRDLTSQDEVPLYFAWERLYATANVNLSTDFLNETRAELRARQQARLTPRQGLPPPLFTSFDKLNRKSMQSSAFLRSSLSSDAAIEMMARRYRREADKLRSSRDKLAMSSVGDTGKRLKKSTRGKKTPQEEVDELLEDLERPSSPERSGFKTTEGGTRTKKKFNRRQQNPEREVEELLAKLENSKVLPESKMRAARTATNKDGFDFAGGKDSFADELVGGAKAAKATELRRSSFSMGNAATDPVLADVENVAAFAAQVSNWRMHPTADTEAKLSQNDTKRVNGANKLKKSTGGEGEADTTFDTALWSSGSDESHFETNGSLRSSAVSTSPTSRRSTAHTSEWADDDEDNLGADEAQLAATDEELHGQPAVGVPNSNSVSSEPGKKFSVASSSAVDQNLQRSHAVGEMQVKIKGKDIQVTFKGSLDDSRINNAALHSEIIQRIAKPSATQKVFGVADTTKLRDGGKGDEHGTAEQPAPIPNAAQDGVHLPRKQSSVRFYGVEDDDVDEDINKGRVLRDHETSQIESEVCGTAVASEPTRHENHSYQARRATQNTAEGESLYHDAVSDEKTTQQIDHEVVYEANSDDANGGLRTSANQVERSTVRGHRREESAQRSEVDPAISSGSARSKNNDRLEPFIPSNAATREVVYKANSDDADGSLRTSASQIERSTVRGHRREESAQPSEVDPAVSSDSVPTRSKNNDRLKPSISSNAAAQNAAEEDSLYSDVSSGEAVELENVKDPNKPRRQQAEREEVHEASDQDSGKLRASSSGGEHRNSTAGERNGVLADENRRSSAIREPHREETTQRKQSKHVVVRSKNNRRPSSGEAEYESQGGVPPQEHSRLERGNRGSSQRIDTAIHRNSTKLSDDDGNASNSDGPDRGRGEELKVTKRSNYRSSSKANDQPRPVSRVEVSSGDSTADSAPRRDTSTHYSRRSRNQQLVAQDSDEDFSDGPDTPDIEYRRHTKNRYDVPQPQRRIPRDTREYAEHEHRERHSSRPPLTRHTSSRHKQRNQSPDSSNDSSYSETQKTHGRHRSGSAERSRPSHSNRDRHGQRRSSRYPAYDLRDRDHHLAAAMESPPKRSKSDIRTKEMKLTKAKHDSRSSKPTSRSLKLPEGIVWPPGMEAECIARLGLDGHHPIAPPGLEHLVTDEQWGDYWTWLHWYSSWQMWYMKNGKKPRRNSDKEKRRGRRHSDSDESPDNEADHAARNANWWLDVGTSKHRRRRSRSD